MVKQSKRDLIELYKQIEKRINSLDFDSIYEGFQPFDFALYDDKIVVFKDKTINYDNRFVGNTAIEYDNKFLAIWRIETIYVNYSILTSKIIHEMFHAYQMKQKEIRFPNEPQGLNYLYEKYNITLKYDETRYLLKAYEEDDFNSLDHFINIRERRRKDYEKECFYEEGIETIEGMARYVELKALNLMDVHEYQKAYDQIKVNLKNLRSYIPVRNISYEIGALMLLIKDKFSLTLSNHIGFESKNLYELLFGNFEKKELYYENSSLDLDFLDKYYQDIFNRISRVLSTNPKVHECDQVIGFDPLNTFRIDHYIYYRHFVMIESRGKQVFIANESVGELNNTNQVFVIYEHQI